MYTATMKGLKPKDVMTLISTLPAHVDVKFGCEKPAAPKAQVLDRVNPEDIVILGSHKGVPREGSLTDIMIKVIEKHEKKHGAGSVTRAMLTDELSAVSDAPGAAISAALKRGVIKGVKL